MRMEKNRGMPNAAESTRLISGSRFCDTSLTWTAYMPARLPINADRITQGNLIKESLAFWTSRWTEGFFMGGLLNASQSKGKSRKREGGQRGVCCSRMPLLAYWEEKSWACSEKC